MSKEKSPPLTLDELEEQKEEGRGSLSITGGGGDENEGSKGKKGLSKFKPSGSSLGILQIFIPILVSAIIAFFIVSAVPVSKGTYSTGMGALQTQVTDQLAAQGASISNIINNYASKSDMAGYAKQSDLNNYAPASSLATLQTQVAGIQTSVAGIGNTAGLVRTSDLANYLLSATASSTYVTQAKFDQAIAYLNTLISQGVLGSINFTAVSSGATYGFLIGPAPTGNYTGIEVTFVFPPSAGTQLGSLSVTQLLTSIATPPAGEVFLPSYAAVGANTYMTGLVVTLTGPGAGGYWFIQLPNVDKLGAWTSVVVKAKL